MDQQVEKLLQEERKMNSLVKQALQQKRDKMAQIQAHTEQAVAQQRRDLNEELAEKIRQVSSVLCGNARASVNTLFLDDCSRGSSRV